MRIRAGAALLAVVGLVALAAPAAADAFSACWVVFEVDRYGFEQQITRCRLAGGDIVDYASDSGIPGQLFPRPGTDITGPCWYYSSTDGNWLFAQLYSNGDAVLGFSRSSIGGFAVLTGRIPRCTSEPTPTSDPVADIWSYVTEYIHPPPVPGLSPEQGDGLTGFETYVELPIPDLHTAQLDSGGTTLDVEIFVSGVGIDWGDGSTDTYPADSAGFSGYPDGIAVHVYETKSESIFISVSYSWAATWRAAGGPWLPIVVPDTTTVVPYPVSEVVSVITN